MWFSFFLSSAYGRQVIILILDTFQTYRRSISVGITARGATAKLEVMREENGGGKER